MNLDFRKVLNVTLLHSNVSVRKRLKWIKYTVIYLACELKRRTDVISVLWAWSSGCYRQLALWLAKHVTLTFDQWKDLEVRARFLCIVAKKKINKTTQSIDQFYWYSLFNRAQKNRQLAFRRFLSWAVIQSTRGFAYCQLWVSYICMPCLKLLGEVSFYEFAIYFALAEADFWNLEILLFLAVTAAVYSLIHNSKIRNNNSPSFRIETCL